MAVLLEERGSQERRAQLARHAQMLTRYARCLVSRSDEAADVVQEASVTILSHPTGPRDPECFGSWCRGVVRFAAARMRRGRSRRRRLFVSQDLESPTPTRLADAEDRMMARELAVRVLAGVDAAARELLVRRYVLDETAADIAEDGRRTAAAVRMQLMRVRGALRSRDLAESIE